MTGGNLDVPQRHPGVKCSSDETVPERVRRDVLGDPGLASHSPDDPRGPVAVEAFSRPGEKDRTDIRSAAARSMARPTRGGNGMTASLEPLPRTVTVR